MNEKCKYCDYVSKCSRICEYNSYLCKMHKSFPKVVDKSYEQLQQENQQLQKELECTIGIVEHNRIISEKNKEINQLKDNWNKLKEYLKNRYDNGTESISYRQVFMEIREAMQVLEIAQELEGSDSNE